MEVAKWLVDCYRAMNKSFSPTATDIASYMQIVDQNRKGKVSVGDIGVLDESTGGRGEV